MISCTKSLTLVSCLFLLLTTVTGQNLNDSSEREIRRIDAAARVLEEVMATPDKGIPEELLVSAKCVAVVPAMMKRGFLVDERFGEGVATCRTSKGWSGPAPFTITGGTWGLQFGGEAVDLLMLVMNEKGMRALQANRLRLGSESSVAAGPVGLHRDITPDDKSGPEVLTYSRARGLFTGLELNGAVLKQDDDQTRALYGKIVPLRSILSGKLAPPQGTKAFLSAVERYSAPRATTSSRATDAAAQLTGSD